MILTTNGIDINKLPIKMAKIKVKSIDEYKKEVKDTMKKIKDDANRGVAIFVDTQYKR